VSQKNIPDIFSCNIRKHCRILLLSYFHNVWHTCYWESKQSVAAIVLLYCCGQKYVSAGFFVVVVVCRMLLRACTRMSVAYLMWHCVIRLYSRTTLCSFSRRGLAPFICAICKVPVCKMLFSISAEAQMTRVLNAIYSPTLQRTRVSPLIYPCMDLIPGPC